MKSMNRIHFLGSMALLSCMLLNPQAFADDAKIEKLESDIARRREIIANEQAKIADSTAQLAKIEDKVALAESVQKSITELMSFQREAQGKCGALERELRDRKLLLDAYRRSFSTQSNLAEGTKFGDLTLKNGKVLNDATFKRRIGNAVQIGHSGGFASVEFTDLPQEIATQFRVPPKADENEINLTSIFGSKPDSLKSDDQAYADRRAEEDRKLKEREALLSQQSDSFRQQMIQDKNEREKIAAANQVLKEEIAKLEASVTQFKAGIDAQESAKRAILDEQKQNKIYGRTTKSTSDLNRITAAYDAKIAVLKAEKAKLEGQISVLEGKIQY